MSIYSEIRQTESDRTMRARGTSGCEACPHQIQAGDPIFWNIERRKARHQNCPRPVAPSPFSSASTAAVVTPVAHTAQTAAARPSTGAMPASVTDRTHPQVGGFSLQDTVRVTEIRMRHDEILPERVVAEGVWAEIANEHVDLLLKRTDQGFRLCPQTGSTAPFAHILSGVDGKGNRVEYRYSLVSPGDGRCSIVRFAVGATVGSPIQSEAFFGAEHRADAERAWDALRSALKSTGWKVSLGRANRYPFEATKAGNTKIVAQVATQSDRYESPTGTRPTDGNLARLTEAVTARNTSADCTVILMQTQTAPTAHATHPDVVEGNRFGQHEAAQERAAHLSDPDYRESLAKAARTEVSTQSISREAQEIAAIQQSRKISDGTYTIVRPDGSYRTLQFRTPKDGDLIGKTIVKYLSGQDNTADYTGCAFYDTATGRVVIWKRYRANEGFCQEILAAVATVAQNPSEAGEAYALQSGRCCRCNRTLTVPASIHRGMGSECAAKYGW
jgi:hypothetical protein